ncbi:MAG: hypothetical protein PHQ40_19785 [Anaerolineaceae bacterium]|nr:hypothetical protein [Anaerolineaceae bacterium]
MIVKSLLIAAIVLLNVGFNIEHERLCHKDSGTTYSEDVKRSSRLEWLMAISVIAIGIVVFI